MGLLQKLSDKGLDANPIEQTPLEDKPVIQKKSNSVGLLKKSLLAGENHGLDFFEFADKYNLEICAILKSQDGIFKIINSLGFDGESICLSHSTQDFWYGTLEETNKLYSFDSSDKTLPFLQFFSDKLKEKITSIQLLITKASSVFIICNSKLKESLALLNDFNTVENTEIDFEKASASLNPLNFNNSFVLDFSEALESFILSNSKNEVVFTKAIIDQIYYDLCKNFPQPQKLEYSKKGKFTLYTSADTVPLELLYNHLKVNYSFILGNHSELLSVLDCKTNIEVAG